MDGVSDGFGVPALRRHLIHTPLGHLHYVVSGKAGTPLVLLLHQSPRSWDEYRDVIPLLADRYHVVAMDSLGFGASDVPAETATIERLAAAAAHVLEHVTGGDGTRAAVVGHHTGGAVGMELTVARPDLVSALVLSGVPWVDGPRRESVAAGRPPIDHVEVSDDGSHLLALWRKREAYYPADRPDLRSRLVLDSLRNLERVEEGHLAVNSYRMEDRAPLVAVPSQVVCGELDTFSLPDVPALLAALPGGTKFRALTGVGVPSVDHDPAQFAQVVGEFLDGLGGVTR